MIGAGSVSLDAVIATGELANRPAREPDSARENLALLQLAAEMGHPSRHLLQRVVEVALDLCRAGSAGLSIVEQRGGKERFRWHAVAGSLRDSLWSTAPQEASPSAITVARNAVQLFVRPDRHFRSMAEVSPPILELLVAPFLVGRRPAGTIWAVAHDRERHFDAEDARLLGDLSQVAAPAYQAYCVIEGLRDSNRKKDEFLAMLSHELRNPLAAMSNAVKYLANAVPLDGDPKRARNVVQRQLAQVIRLSDDLLDVSRIGHGTLELRRERTDLVSAVRLGREAAAPALGESDREITVTLPDAPMWVEGDATRLSQIVTNLLTNAARRTRSAGTVSLSLRAEGGDAVVLVSSETDRVATGWAGPGSERYGAPMPAEHAAEAQGIGLTLVRNLTEMHGGQVATISVGGGVDNGFEVRLPLLGVAGVITTERIERQSENLRLPGRPRRERVLIIDDSVDASDSLAMLLRSWGYDVRTAQGASAGLRLEWEFEPQAVILDIEMPGKNGYEVAAELRVRRRRDLLLVALSGHAREEDRTRSLEAGFDHHLTKPANVDMLQRLLS
jgi:signal transduction histidine kinase